MKKDLRSFGNILKQEGTSQYDRFLPALDPQSVLIDDRKLEDFIAFAQHYAKHLLYVSADRDQVTLTESWDYFFKNNSVLLIANIATKNAAYYKETHDHLLELFNQDKSLANFTELLEFTFSRFKKLNSWYYAAAPDSALNFDLKLYISSYLQQELESLQEMLLYTRNLNGTPYRPADFQVDLFSTHSQPDANEREINDILKNLNISLTKTGPGGLREKVKSILQQDNVWELRDKENIPARERLFAGNTDEEKLTSASWRLNKIFDAVYHASESIINNCHGYFEETVHQQQNHPPHLALFIAFIKLYGYAQQELNKLPQRHLDFYYKEVLQIKTKPAVPDQTYVVFELAKGFTESALKKGTALSAGKDQSNTELIYEIQEDISINKAQVAAVHTVFMQQDADKQTLNYFTEALDTNLAASDPGMASWKIFGEPKPALLSEIGFGMASTQFYLAKGERKVVITLEVEEPIAVEEFNPRLLRLLLTGEKGWLNSDEATSNLTVHALTRTAPTTLELKFSVSITQESAIVAYDPALHPGNFRTNLPVAQFILKYPRRQVLPEDPQYPVFQENIQQLNVLQQLKITAVSIRVQVGSLNTPISFDGVKELLIENNDAALDSKKPFYPFSAVPKVGSAFYLGCKDLYYKNIDKLSVNLEWLLPDNFSTYYSKYLPPYDSHQFKATLSILNNKRWRKLNDVSIIDKTAVDPHFRSLRIDFHKLKINPEPSDNYTETAVDTDRKDGTLRLKLNYPDFGHSIYPQLITTAVMEKANSKYGSVDFYKVVKKHLYDSRITIKLPEDMDQRQGSLRVVYDILEKVPNTNQARGMIVNSLSEMIRRVNGSNVIVRKPKPATEAEDITPEEEGRVLVNDDNYIERILRFLKKVNLVDDTIFYDKNQENTTSVVNEVKEAVNSKADFILPSDKELESVIITEASNAIGKTVANVVDDILALRQSNGTDPVGVAELLKKEFQEANEVINDMIARKIAILLSSNELPPPPYAPLVNALALSYSATKAANAHDDQFFHITPLGVFRINAPASSSPAAPARLIKTSSIFPKNLLDNPQRTEVMPGMLFIGLRDVVPNQNVAVLVQVAEGSRVNDKKPPPVHWWYLRNDEWQKLNEDGLISDSTHGLQTTGILQFAIPAYASNTSLLFNASDLFWLCASVAHDPDAFPRLVSLKAQAALVQFVDQDNDPRHLSLPLEAYKIKNLVNKIPAVKKVSQPVSSFNGQVQEHESMFYTRVSERLRHKNRAVTNWDYERLVLAHFPAIFKVKCLNNYYNGQFVTGHVTVVPVSDLRNKNYYGSNLLFPKTSYIDLRNIEKVLRAHAAPFVQVHAINPQLDQVFIRCKVKFHTNVDQGYYLQQLNQDLIQFLTPWASGQAESLAFSAKIYASSIINFIDQRDYVDYVVDLIMQQYTETDSGEKIFAVDTDQLTSLVETKFTTGHSILVSAPKHEIELI
ncbi:baseplate J/gp47 family protein [Adhaeribacter pallidiroseus]|uniref:Uncharacterized protein n=1 Tax=Adhaeribacter pallidiroseus TaxID=2072847 RepID=A0A369QCQ7_9BACT|nr:baseplate J/gp47 family protein [Adhaeribacter pallidiroseus]RDC62683.1 hypothetical protein AHMF7616_01277 [Adhaeribacter pallidiroseus]